MSPQALTLADGLTYHPGFLDPQSQVRLLQDLEAVFAAAPPFTPRMPRTGKPFSVRMTNCGPLGWISDERGYRYQAVHPETGARWPEMPDLLRRAWAELSGSPHPAEACLVNLYANTARMALHQDRDEEDFEAPVVSLSFGNTALFRFGGTDRRAPTRSIRLKSGDAVVIGGASRLVFHGVDRVLPGTSDLLDRHPGSRAWLPEGGRINLTLRRVTRPGD
jgi:alkylated DNA repair protein (DNA oxidative demethylase)